MGPAYIRVRSSLEHACWCMAFYQEHESRTCIVGQHSCEPARNSSEEFFKTWSNFNAPHFLVSSRSISRTAVCTKTESFFGLDFKQAIHVFIISFSQSCIDLD
ncbi:hypothetical protein Peur_004240 [Populus x canadensis]